MEFVGPFENDHGRRSWGFVKDDEGHAGSWLWENSAVKVNPYCKYAVRPMDLSWVYIFQQLGLIRDF